MIDRRRLLASAGAGLVAAAVPRAVHAAAAGTLRLASVKYGSLSWVIETIRALELDKKAGLALDVVEVASNQAGPVALLAGGADVIVSDWTWAMRQRSLGEKLKFSAYSSALGGVVVADNSPITGISGLDGKTLGVAGSAIDKSWLLLRAYSKKTIGQDMASYAHPQFGAAPLLAEQIRSGRIDAVLNFWTHAARLTGSGFKEILSIESVMKDLGIDPVPALVGFIWKESFEEAHSAQIEKLLNVVREANAVLATDDSAWDRLRPIVKPKSDGEYRSIMAAYRAGIPKPWGTAEIESARKLMQVLVDAGDAELMGRGTQFDVKLFHHATS
ncbi:ABC transporter substrate-binding protein [Hyphomicrobium sp.]|uniref:ABC transporter substrate-binding protein n=1 Tax=Hyphomicrobium sp. TaxID=82 RepID=UPI003F72F90A